MKLFHVFLIGSAVIVPAVTYVALTSETNQAEIHSTKLSSPIVEKLTVHGLAVKDDTKDGEFRESLTALGKEVSQLRADLTSLRAELQTKHLAQVSSAKVSEQDAATDAQALTEIRVKEEERLQKQGEALEAGFRQQTTDPDWSTKAKGLIQQALASDKVDSKNIIDVECRTSMCRVELANDTNSNAPRIAEFPMKISEELPNILVNQTDESDGSTTTILYLSKDDFVLPNSGG
ncbi:hypothetical protein [Methyloglobulus sp.]|uniref:hypothetical protein n=1 Tax=Methyloglobulus sp. TaxID=2518622 RepID=UPI0032B81EEB